MWLILSALLVFALNSTRGAPPSEGTYLSPFESILFNFSSHHPDKNFVISPFAVWSIINSVAYGAEGDTLHEILRGFDIPENRMSQIEIYKKKRASVVNAFYGTMNKHNFIFFDTNLRLCPYVEDVLVGEFSSDVKRLDFDDPLGSSVAANYFIKMVSGLTFEAFEPRDFAKDSFVLANVRYIKGIFHYAFDPEGTMIRTFFNEDGFEIGKANYMQLKAHIPHINVPELGSHIVELRYGNQNHYSLLLVVPYSDYRIDKIQSKLNRLEFKHTLKKLENSLIDQNVFVHLTMPRFRIQTESLDFRHALNEIGIFSMFDNEAAAFTLMTESKLFVSKISQLSVIEVDEEGIVPVNDSKAEYEKRGVDLRVVKLNRPFLFFVLSKPSATILLEGKYSIPEIY